MKKYKKCPLGIPLNDTDRMDLVEAIKLETIKQLHYNNVIIACSALKDMYREKIKIK